MKIEIQLPPTKYTWTIFIAKTLEKADKEVRKSFKNVDFSDLGETTEAFSCHFVYKKEKFIITGLPKNASDLIIIHEVTHITWYLASLCGFNYKKDPELQCYFIEYLYDELKKHL